MGQYKNLDLEIERCYYKKLNPTRIRLNFNHRISDFIWNANANDNEIGWGW